MDVEVNIEDYNYTVFFEEVYDGNGASAVIEFFGTATSQAFVNFTSQTAFLVYADNSCVMGTLVTPTLLSDVIQQSFEPYYSGGNVRVASVLDLFKLANASAVYFGQDIVRGIPADRWQACITSLNTTYLFDFYYSSNGWVASFNKNQVPLLLVITRLGGQQNVTTHLFTFVDVNTGPGAVSASSFQVPLGLICKDRPPGKSLPPIPNNFNVLIETVSSTFQAVRVFQSYYSYDSLLFLSEGYVPQTNRSTLLVQDFYTLTRYTVDKVRGQCTVDAIGPNSQGPASYSMDSEAGLTVRMRTPNEFFLGVDDAAEFSFVYEGTTLIRRILSDAWITFRPFEKFSNTVNLTNATYEIFFTSPQWSSYSVDAKTTNPAILRLQWTGTLNYPRGSIPFSQYVDFVDFDDVQPAVDVYDMSTHCQSASDYVVLTMMVPGTIQTVDISMLKGSIRQNLINFAWPLNVRPLQIGNIQIISESNGQIVISLRISNMTSFNSNITIASANSIVSALNAAIASNNGQFPFNVSISANSVVQPIIQPFPAPAVTITITTTTTTTAITTSPTVCPVLTSGFSSQGTVVLAICMVLVGILIVIGVLLVVVCVRKCSSSGPFSLETVAYKKHTNELVS